MTTAFAKLLHCIVLIRACLFARGRFIYYWMKRCFFIQYKCCIDTRFSKCSSQQFAGFTVCEEFPSLLHYLSLSILSISIDLFWDRVTASLFFASDVAVVDVIVTRKRELSNAKSLFRGSWKFSPKNLLPDKLSLYQ